VVFDDQADGTNVAGTATERPPKTRG
jgi:hypothetical protein